MLFFKKKTEIYCTESIYTCTRTTYKIIPLTNLNKYWHYDSSETKVNLNLSAIKGGEKLWERDNCDFR